MVQYLVLKLLQLFKILFFDYCTESKKITKPFSNKKNITVMSIDNLPSELPRDSSRFFGEILKEKILPILNEKNNKIIDDATIAKDGKLTENYNYLSDFIS